MPIDRSVAARVTAALCALSGLACAAAQEPSAPSRYKVVCGQECLREFADRFLEALTHGDATAVPLAPNVRYTENGQQLAIGDALWATAEGLGNNTLVFTDPGSGGIQLYAGVLENGLPSMLAGWSSSRRSLTGATWWWTKKTRSCPRS